MVMNSIPDRIGYNSVIGADSAVGCRWRCSGEHSETNRLVNEPSGSNYKSNEHRGREDPFGTNECTTARRPN